MDNKLDNEIGFHVNEAVPEYAKRYTYTDYLTWDDDKRRELIDGIPFLMSAPNRRHQKLSGRLYIQIAAFLKDRKCEVYYAPFDVRLNADTLDNTVVQPDLIIVCDHSILNDAGCKGAPDMAIEILSPSTSRYDRTLKFNTYLKAGIREYWVIDPETNTLAVHLLKNGSYIISAYTDENEAVPVSILKGCVINLTEVFEE